MHYDDLVLCHYSTGPYDAREWKRPLLTVGWIEHPHHFPIGDTEIAFQQKLATLVNGSRSNYPHYYFRGCYSCTLCVDSKVAGPNGIWSQENIFVPGDGVIYVSPGAIVHYVGIHRYSPPVEFISAVMDCPDYGSPAFCDALRKANGDYPSPLLTQQESDAEFAAAVKMALEHREQNKKP